MKRKTYNTLSRIPLIKPIVDMVTDIPFIYHFPGSVEKRGKILGEYQRTHPDEILTRQLIKKIRSEAANKE